jgi:hypothetical protein
VQMSADQSLTHRIKKEEMKCRIIQGITLATARLTARLAQNSPAEIEVSVPFVGGLKTFAGLNGSRVGSITSDNICHMKFATTGRNG